MILPRNTQAQTLRFYNISFIFLKQINQRLIHPWCVGQPSLQVTSGPHKSTFHYYPSERCHKDYYQGLLKDFPFGIFDFRVLDCRASGPASYVPTLVLNDNDLPSCPRMITLLIWRGSLINNDIHIFQHVPGLLFVFPLVPIVFCRVPSFLLSLSRLLYMIIPPFIG